ncbi:hypothetical protein HYX19_02545 [Candidatus Woesearchaeota archaeon]|nr:hypothetical protein [Candidatus Woesearchaeota archaeon]
MFWWFKKKRNEEEHHKKIKELRSLLHDSVSNINGNLQHVGRWINHFKEKQQHHAISLKEIERRITRIERDINKIQELEVSYNIKPKVVAQGTINLEEDKKYPKTDEWELLTEVQKILCYRLAAIEKETPKRWISLKYLAQEIYPDKNYESIRSTISEYTSNLEELGFIQKRRKGKQTFIISTEKNPCLTKKEKKKIKLQQKI